jgi:predicted exporter
VMAVQSRAQIEREVKWLSIGGAITMSLLMGAALGSLRAVLLAALPVLSGVMAGIAAVGVCFGGVHGMTLGFGSTLIGEAVDYAIYYLIQVKHGSGADKSSWIKESWPTVRLGLLTSLCGFTALAFSGFPGLAQLGVFSVAGLLAAALGTRYVLPVFNVNRLPNTLGQRGLSYLANGLFLKLRRTHDSNQNGLLSQINLKNLSLLLSLAALVLLTQQKDSIWRGDLTGLSPVPPAAIQLDAQLRADLSTSDAASLILVQETSEERALRTTEALSPDLNDWVEQGLISGFDSPARWLPSMSTQIQRQKNLPDEPTLRTRLRLATQDSPLPAARLEPFIEDVQTARKATPVTRADLNDSPVAPLIDALVSFSPPLTSLALPAGVSPRLGADRQQLLHRQAGGGVTVFIPLHAPLGLSSINTSALQQRLRQLQSSKGFKTVQLLNVKQELDSLYAHYLHEAIWQALIGGAAVLLLLLAWLQSPTRWVRVCWPLLLALLLTLGGLVALQIPLGVLHLVGLLLVLALGSNYALFFDQLQHRDASKTNTTLASLLLANLTTVLSFGLIAFSQIPALSAIGRVVAPGAFLALCLAAIWVPRSH